MILLILTGVVGCQWSVFICMMEKSSKITNFIKAPEYDYLIKLLALGKWNVFIIKCV